MRPTLNVLYCTLSALLGCFGFLAIIAESDKSLPTNYWILTLLASKVVGILAIAMAIYIYKHIER